MRIILSMKIAIIVLAILLSPFYLQASGEITQLEALKKMEEASEKYNNGSYTDAIDIYESLLVEDYESLGLYHNLGLAYFKNNEIGKAILNLERAKRINPYKEEINHNLSLIKENIEMDIVPVPDFFLKRWYQNIVYLASVNVWLFLHLFFLFSAVILLYIYLFKHELMKWHKSYTMGVLVGLVVFSIIFAFFTYSRDLALRRNDVGIVNDSEVVLRAGAEDNSLEIMILEEGLKVLVKDQIGTFLKVRLEDYTEGWVIGDAIDRI